MKTRNWIAVLGCAALLATAGGAQARDRALLTISGGVFDLVLHHRQDFEGGFQYRFAYNVWESDDGAFQGFHPIVGAFANTSSGVLGYAGFAAPFDFDDHRWELTPEAAVAAYSHGNSLDLGGIFEFRLGLGASYKLGRYTRLGVELEHVSNANIHNKNPGTNNALLTWSWIIDGY